jgi:uncharacterized transporter YbjL
MELVTSNINNDNNDIIGKEISKDDIKIENDNDIVLKKITKDDIKIEDDNDSSNSTSIISSTLPSLSDSKTEYLKSKEALSHFLFLPPDVGTPAAQALQVRHLLQ